uniref:Uncharacterized protein n=1 Tax=Rhizophora mucronata TaxID=61149 RepID=A0A2P2K1N8_RHIMU
MDLDPIAEKPSSLSQKDTLFTCQWLLFTQILTLQFLVCNFHCTWLPET